MSARMSNPDPRLWCNCGEIGEVKPDEFDGVSGYRVFCKRNGAPCCMGRRGDTPDEAMDHFAKTQNESMHVEPDNEGRI